MDWVVVHGMRKLVQVKDTFQYIPIIGVLQAMLQNQAIYKEVKAIINYVYTYVYMYIYNIAGNARAPKRG